MDAVGDGITGGVALRDDEGGARYVRRVNRCAGEILFAAGAAFAEREAVEGDFDELLGFGAGNQDVRRYFKLEAPEFLFASEMLCWFAGGAACEERGETFGIGAGDLFFGIRVEPSAVATEDVEQQKFRGEREGRNVRVAQLGEPLFQGA